MKFKNFPMVKMVVYGRGCFDQTADIIKPHRKGDYPFIYIVDDVFKDKQELIGRVPLSGTDKIVFASAADEPKTKQVDAIANELKDTYGEVSGVIGIGGGSMLDLAKAKNVKAFMFTSSSEVYGDPDPNFVPTKEEYRGNVSILGPRAVYDESKRIGETMCEAFYNVYDIPTRCVRPFNVYGPGIRPDDYRVLPNFVEHALRREPLPVHGDGRNTRAYCYINDAIECIFRILLTEECSGESFNIGNPDQEISVKGLADIVKEVVEEEVPSFTVNINFTEPPLAVYADSDPKRRCPDISKVNKFTGYEPKYSLKEGLSRTIKWYQEVHPKNVKN